MMKKASTASIAGSSGSDPAIAKFLHDMRQMQEELRVVHQGEEETTQRLSLQAHSDNFTFKRKAKSANTRQTSKWVAVVSVSSCLNCVEVVNAGGGGGGGGGGGEGREREQLEHARKAIAEDLYGLPHTQVEID